MSHQDARQAVQEEQTFAPPVLPPKKRHAQAEKVASASVKKRRTSDESSFGQSSVKMHNWWRFGEINRDLVGQLPVHKVNDSIQVSNGLQNMRTNKMFSRVSEIVALQHLSERPTLASTSKIPSNAPMVEDHISDSPADEESSESVADSVVDSGGEELKFRAYQAENWTEKFEELLEFRNRLGHCLVPNAYEENPPLAQWVKRQRYQYKLKLEGKRSTMSDERVKALEEIGFVWDSHNAAWEERLDELLQYRENNGQCNVPSRYAKNRQLAIWVKRQRRQYKFFCEGSPSSMTPERINILEGLGFQWDLRNKK
jgi:hypothetical protein